MSPKRDDALARLASGETWTRFLKQLEVAGQVVMSAKAPDDPLTRAEGFRYLSRITRAALQTFVEHNDPLAPVLQRVVHETAKMGADNPDNHYQNAAISGAHRYRIVGTRGSVHFLSFATQKGSYGQGRGMPPTGHLDGTEISLEADGSLVIDLACERPAGATNWLPMEPKTGTLIVRQSRLDVHNEVLADLRVERVGGDGRPTPFDPVDFDAGLAQSGALVAGAAMIFQSWAEGFAQHTNELPLFDPKVSNAFGGVPDILYYHSYWRLAPDEALLIEAPHHPCDHWNFQLNNHWMESLDYRYFRIHLNSKTAVYEADGSIKVVVAHTDPGHQNWIQTVGHAQGTMCFRWVRPEPNAPEPSVRVVKLADVLA